MMHTSSGQTGSSTLTRTNGPATDVSLVFPSLLFFVLIISSVMTFSAGPRGCIGKTFALTEAIVILSLLVRNFELFPVTPADSQHRSREELRRALLGYSVDDWAYDEECGV